MKLVYDLERLRRVMQDIYTMTGYTISIWDTAHEELAFAPDPMRDFCALVKGTETGPARCARCDNALLERTCRARRPCVHRCHMGLIDAAAPILYMDTILGYVMFGQMADSATEQKFLRAVQEITDDPATLTKLSRAMEALPRYSAERVESAGRIITLCASSIALENMIRVENDMLAAGIDAYIRADLTRSLHITALCRQFHISKNTLYAISKQFFGMTIASYVTKCRMEKARELLAQSDLLVYQIAQAVGFPDGNYFVKVFRKFYGVTPGDLRAAMQAHPTDDARQATPPSAGQP